MIGLSRGSSMVAAGADGKSFWSMDSMDATDKTQRTKRNGQNATAGSIMGAARPSGPLCRYSWILLTMLLSVWQSVLRTGGWRWFYGIYGRDGTAGGRC